jgi:hypothetical protein
VRNIVMLGIFCAFLFVEQFSWLGSDLHLLSCRVIPLVKIMQRVKRERQSDVHPLHKLEDC